jgi:hypothetical protein
LEPLHLRRVLFPETLTRNDPVMSMNEANQLVTAAMTMAFVLMMLISARSYMEQRSAGEVRRPVAIASLRP